MKHDFSPPIMNTILILISIAIIVVASFFGASPIPALKILKAFLGDGDDTTRTILYDIRIPRSIAAWLAGACLGASGAALQGLLRNPLADPGVLGVSTTAALGAVIALYFNLTVLGFWIMPLAAIFAALMTTIFLYGFGAGYVSTTRLILVGVGLSSFAGAMITLVMNLAPNPFVLSDLINWLFGTVANRSIQDLMTVFPFMLAGGFLLLLGHRDLTALTLGEETAITLGINLKQTRMLIITGTALMTGASVALAGAIGFVGIVVPHLIRPLFHFDPGRIIFPSALLAGCTLVIADIIIRILPFHQELKLGVVAAILGAPAFVWVVAKTRKVVS